MQYSWRTPEKGSTESSWGPKGLQKSPTSIVSGFFYRAPQALLKQSRQNSFYKDFMKSLPIVLQELPKQLHRNVQESSLRSPEGRHTGCEPGSGGPIERSTLGLGPETFLRHNFRAALRATSFLTRPTPKNMEREHGKLVIFVCRFLV